MILNHVKLRLAATLIKHHATPVSVEILLSNDKKCSSSQYSFLYLFITD